MRDLREGDVDFVIGYFGPNETLSEDLASVVIGEDELIPVCKPSADGEPLFAFDRPGVEMPYLRFGDAAPINAHLEPVLREQNLKANLRTVYENSMAGALRIRARAGDGVAWLPKSLVKPDFESGQLVRTGEPFWKADLQIRLFRNPNRTNRLTRSIWSFLEVREGVPLLVEE